MLVGILQLLSAAVVTLAYIYCYFFAAAAVPDQMYMIVGFEVSPCSIKRTAGKPIEDIVCDNIDRVPTPQVRTHHLPACLPACLLACTLAAATGSV
jgi:hypothetical protein